MTTLTRTPIPLGQRLLVNARGVAELLSIGRSRLFELKKSRWLPAPVEIDGSVRWSRSCLSDWVNAGCPYGGDWTWRPSLPAKLDDLIRARHREVEELQAELGHLQALKRAGATSALIGEKH